MNSPLCLLKLLSGITIDNCGETEIVNAYILTGGKSLRMGQDKSFLKVGNKTFAEFIFHTLKIEFDSVKLIGKKHEHKGLPFIKDRFQIQCAINGIVTALMDSGTEWNFIISVDMPLVSKRLISYIRGSVADDASIVLPSLDGRWYPTCAFYHKSVAPVFQRALETQKFRLLYHIKKNNPVVVNADRYRREMLNINTPVEYQLFKKLIREK